MRRVPIATVLTAGGLVLILVLYACTFVVRFNEAVIKLRFGKADEAAYTAPGVYFKWFPPIESIKKYDVRKRTIDTSESEVKTADGKNVIISAAAVWQIKNPLEFFKKVPNGDEENAAGQIRNRLNQAQAAVVGRMNMTELVNLDPAIVDAGHARFRDEMLNFTERLSSGEQSKSVHDQILADFGVELLMIHIRRVSLPESATQVVMNSMQQERKAIAEKFRKEGDALAESIKSKADANANAILSFAEAKAKEIQSAGVLSSGRVLDQIAPEDVEFFEWLRWLEAMRRTLTQNSTIFLDQKSEIYQYFSHPSSIGGADAKSDKRSK